MQKRAPTKKKTILRPVGAEPTGEEQSQQWLP